MDGHGALRAVETQGACYRGNQKLLEDQTGGALLALDRRDIQESRAVLLMPLRPGTIQLSSMRKWRQPMLATGEIQDAKWRNYESSAAKESAHGLSVQVTSDQAFSLLLLTESSETRKWCRGIEEAIADPASLP